MNFLWEQCLPALELDDFVKGVQGIEYFTSSSSSLIMGLEDKPDEKRHGLESAQDKGHAEPELMCNQKFIEGLESR
jgi:hypothetical protein